MMRLFHSKEKALGVAPEKRRYDLPLNKGSGTTFLVLLICLMSFLAVLALAASFALGAMTARWSSGLENRVTVEIPAENAAGEILAPEQVKGLATRTANLLDRHPAVASTHILSDDEIRELVEPWLGTDALLLGKVPLPALIAVQLHESDLTTYDTLTRQIKTIAPQARLDTHEEWLTDLLRFTGALQFAAALLTVIIGLTTLTAVAGAVRARLAVHDEEVELLHLMGASDNYIARQFQRHSLILALQGSFAGLLAGALALAAIGWISGELEVNLLPDFRLGTGQMIALATIPVITALIAVAAARRTVLSVLRQMP